MYKNFLTGIVLWSVWTEHFIHYRRKNGRPRSVSVWSGQFCWSVFCIGCDWSRQ